MLGPYLQNGFVVEDWQAAAMHWVETLGVGPFFAVRHVEFAECFFRGQPTDVDMTVAIAYSGNQQIELVEQHNDAPSIYTEFLADNPPGLQHMGTLVEDLDAVIDRYGFADRLLQHGRTEAGQRFAYVDTAFCNGTMIELIEADAAMHKAFAHMRAAAADWDGRDPIRG